MSSDSAVVAPSCRSEHVEGGMPFTAAAMRLVCRSWERVVSRGMTQLPRRRSRVRAHTFTALEVLDLQPDGLAGAHACSQLRELRALTTLRIDGWRCARYSS